MKRDTRTPTFWSSEPVGQLPKGQGAFAFADAPEPRRCLYCDALRADVRSEDASPPLCGPCLDGWKDRHPHTPPSMGGCFPGCAHRRVSR